MLKVVQEICGRERLCPEAFLQDIIKTQLQRWDILIHKNLATALGWSFTLAASASGQHIVWWLSVNLLFSRKGKKLLEKEVEADVCLKPRKLVGRSQKLLMILFPPGGSSACKICHVSLLTRVCTFASVCALHTLVVFLFMYLIYLIVLGTLFIFPATNKMPPHRQKSCTQGLSLEVIFFCSQWSY